MSGHHGETEASARGELARVAAAGALLALGLASEHLGARPDVARYAWAGALACAGWSPTGDALAALRRGRVDIESLMVLAALGAAALGAWFEAAFLLFLFSLGHALEARAMDQARDALQALARLRPDTARVLRDGRVVDTPVAEVARGDRLLVRPGDRIPLDGVVVAGRSAVDRSTLTGESVPVACAEGAEVYAGTLNGDGAIEVEVRRLAAEGALARLVELVRDAEANQGPAQRLSARIEAVFVPVVLVAAPLLAVVLALSGLPLRDAALRGISLLVAASPCALAISTPAAVLSALARAARGGVLVKGGAHLDALGSATAVAFDKTGTLTVGTPSLASVVAHDDADEHELLAVAAALELRSGHPLARAVLAGAADRGAPVLTVHDVEAIHGRGVVGRIDDTMVAVGNEALFDEPVPAALAATADRLRAAGQTVMVVRRGRVWLGALGVADRVRPEAAPMLARLRRLGVSRTVLLSGDHDHVARAVARELGIPDARGSLSPEDKVRALRELGAHGGVAMVGDGVNDAPALAAASVGVALGGAGSDVARETADVVLMADDLGRLPFAVGLSRATVRTVRQNLTVALGVSAVLALASILGWVRIAEAVVLHEGSTVVVALNGLRLLVWSEDADDT